MPYVAAKCPNCGGGLRLDTRMEKCYCVHCGSLFNFSDAIKSENPNNPAEIIGYENDNMRCKNTIRRIIEEMKLYQKMAVYDIEAHLNKAYSTSWWFVFIAVLPALFIIIRAIMYSLERRNTITTLLMLAGPVFLSAIYIVFIIFIFISQAGYYEIKRRAAVKIQTALFIKRCSNILTPLEIKDFQYLRDIFNEDCKTLESEIDKLTQAQDSILYIDKSIYYKKPYIRYSFIDFIKGNDPSGYYDKES